MDSQIPNRVVEEWLGGGHFFSRQVKIRREVCYENSRFDLYAEDKERKAFLEVKGVTLEEDGIARFPDAPTERGVKHIEELMICQKDGYEAWIFFLIQMKGVRYLEPNDRTHPEFDRRFEEPKRPECGCRRWIAW